MNKPVEIFWEGSLRAAYSIALTNRDYCTTLLDSGLIDLTTVTYETPQSTPEPDPRLQRLEAHDLRANPGVLLAPKDRPAIWVRHQFPPLDRRPPRGAKWIIMQPWELSRVPDFYADILRKADEVWTASNYGRRAMVDSGVSPDKVFVIPNGIDPGLFLPQGDRYPLPTTKSFRFLFVGATLPRKGIDLLLETFCSTFTAQDDVCLVIKDSASPTWYQGQTSEAQIRSYAAKPNGPEIIYLTDYLSREHMAALYRACDVFVSPYRGEGFSLPTLEAMASGLPVIVTAGGATDDFVDEQVGWRIRAGFRSVGYSAFGRPLSSEGFVLEPDTDHLIALMRSAYEARDQVREKGLRAAVRAQAWTWQHAVRQVFCRVDALCGTDLQSQYTIMG